LGETPFEVTVDDRVRLGGPVALLQLAIHKTNGDSKERRKNEVTADRSRISNSGIG
jgi:hypothetical protein